MTSKESMAIIEKDGEYYLIGGRCPKCNALIFPRTLACPACLQFDGLNEELVGNVGRISNFTIAHVAPSGFTPPYAIGFIEIEDGVQVLSMVKTEPEHLGSLQIGTHVRLGANKDASGWFYYPNWEENK